TELADEMEPPRARLEKDDGGGIGARDGVSGHHVAPASIRSLVTEPVLLHLYRRRFEQAAAFQKLDVRIPYLACHRCAPTLQTPGIGRSSALTTPRVEPDAYDVCRPAERRRARGPKSVPGCEAGIAIRLPEIMSRSERPSMSSRGLIPSRSRMVGPMSSTS